MIPHGTVALALILATATTTRAQSQVAYQWKSVQIRGGGFVTGIVTHPRQPGLMYARTDVGGAYRWNPADESWIAITDMFGFDDWHLTGIESLAIDPQDPERVYLAAGIYNNPGVARGEILRSSDRGESWQRTKMPFGMGGNESGRGNGERLAVDPGDGRILLFGSRDAGLWRSGDRGATWARQASFPSIAESDDARVLAWGSTTQAVGIVNVTFVPTDEPPGEPTRTIYAAVSTTKPGWYRSTDAGQTWQVVPDQPIGSRPATAALASDGVLYVTCSNGPAPNATDGGSIWKHDIRSGTWTDITPVPPGGQNGSFGYGGISVSNSNPDLLAATTFARWGRDDVFYSEDGGSTWIGTNRTAVRDAGEAPWLASDADGQMGVGHWMADIEFDPFDNDKVYYVTGGGIIGSLDFTRAGDGQPTHWIPRVKGLEETVPLALVSPTEGPALISGVGDIGGFTHFDLDQPAAEPHRPPRFSNTTGLDSATDDPSLVVRVGRRNWGDETSATMSFSTDGGRTWRPVPSMPAGGVDQGHVAVSADGGVWIWSPDGRGAAWRTDNHGQSWTQVDGIGSRIRIASDGVNSRRFYATANEEGAIFASTDGGRSFQPAAAKLPKAGYWSQPVAALDVEGLLYFGTQEGVFRSRDCCHSFERVGPLTNVVTMGQGRPAVGADEPALYAAAMRDGEAGFYRSVDGGQAWSRINDDRHQFGEIRVITGDPKSFGRVYVGTGGRGILYGDPVDAR